MEEGGGLRSWGSEREDVAFRGEGGTLEMGEEVVVVVVWEGRICG